MAKLHLFGTLNMMRLSRKRFRRYMHCLETGKLSSAYKFEDMHHFYVEGGLVVWVPNSTISPKGRICWQSVDGKSDRKIRTISAPCLFEADGCSTNVDSLSLNTSGVLLIRLKAGDSTFTRYGRHRINGFFQPRNRTVVFSLVKQKILWHRDLNAGQSTQVVPFLVGESRVYVATRGQPHTPWLLEAYDLKCGERLYQSNVLSIFWYSGYLLHGPEYARVIKAAYGEEFLLQTSTPDYTRECKPWSQNTIDIIRGISGHVIR
ncbi:hypothetical protein BJX99DRAFT_256592 [Aspergillus californicus]